MEIRVTYDEYADAAMVYLREIGPGEIEHTVEAVPETIFLDFCKDDRLIGIEILGARSTLPEGLLKLAERLG